MPTSGAYRVADVASGIVSVLEPCPVGLDEGFEQGQACCGVLGNQFTCHLIQPRLEPTAIDGGIPIRVGPRRSLPRRQCLPETRSQLLRAIGHLKAKQAILDRWVTLCKFEEDLYQPRGRLTMQERVEIFRRNFRHVFRGRIHFDVELRTSSEEEEGDSSWKGISDGRRHRPNESRAERRQKGASERVLKN